MAATPTGERQRIVARFQDGRLVKGTTHDFFPAKPTFHVVVEGNESAPAVPVELQKLKALFFVRSYEGNPQHQEQLELAGAEGQGRRIHVVFKDGEELAGFTMGYNPTKPGFFLFPVDQSSNNLRVYVVSAAVRKVEWA